MPIATNVAKASFFIIMTRLSSMVYAEAPAARFAASAR
jgi:hypothetical protein